MTGNVYFHSVAYRNGSLQIWIGGSNAIGNLLTAFTVQLTADTVVFHNFTVIDSC